MNFEIDADAGCDYECAIWKPHQHITIIDNTPPTELEAELQRMRVQINRAKGITHPVDALFALSPTDMPFPKIVYDSRVPPENIYLWDKRATLSFEPLRKGEDTGYSEIAYEYEYGPPQGAVFFEARMEDDGSFVIDTVDDD